MNKDQYLTAMHNGWSSCQACGLCQERQQVVFGYGNPDAQVMIVGEAPGENEDRQGVPFIGAAGQLLDQYLAYVSVRDDVHETVDTLNKLRNDDDRWTYRRRLRELLLEDYYFTNVVMCRPPENRDPIPKEMEACRARLVEQIYTIDPVIIVSAGSISTTALVGKKVSITSQRGELMDIELPGRIGPVRYPLMPVLHPSYLLRSNDFKQKGGNGTKTYNDFVRVMELVDSYNLRHYGTPLPKRPKKEPV
jgi:uracil-DNA glycosylase family 4